MYVLYSVVTLDKDHVLPLWQDLYTGLALVIAKECVIILEIHKDLLLNFQAGLLAVLSKIVTRCFAS